MKPDVISSIKEIRELINRALKEDVGSGDATTLALVPSGASAKAAIISRGSYVVSGTTVARNVFRHIDRTLKCTIVTPDRNKASKGNVIMRIAGKVRSILTAERTALNFLQRMTGIATLTSAFVTKVKPYNVNILDTRKTTPTLRSLEKYAVLCGGGCNHRMGLYDRILIKDNHRKLWTTNGSRGLDVAVQEARRKYPDMDIEVEVESIDD
ncbi:MAG: carboxylating nicotinate-nucleotide diphosphorylase, partial [Kiritimatiellae bacterium]|nr:carboxylating nicotinate-nucleotide diphosphorylase [Kiritimatiellia bacterium]